MIGSSFSPLDWVIFFTYFAILGLSSYWFSREKISSSREYFTASNSMGVFAVSISILATAQSAATFLGVPEYAFSKDFTLIGFYVVSLLSVFFVAKFFVPAFYEMRAISVYELLERRYGASAKRQAGVMFLLGRILASGARLYIAALAVSMILFLDIAFAHMLFSIIVLLLGSLIYAYFGGVKSIILSDVIQAFTYVSAGVVVLIFLYSSLENVEIFKILDSQDKLRLVDTSLGGNFSVLALLSGWLLLNIAAFGLDQDLAQRVLTCKNKADAQRSLIYSILLSIPVVLIFLAIGALLFVFYEGAQIERDFEGEQITIFMYYILHEMPEGLRGFVTVGAIAVALSSTTSVLGALSSVAIEDIYRPHRLKRHPDTDESHFLKASKNAVLLFAFALLVMAVASYFWQRYAQLSIIDFALGVMAFTYTGLLGVYFAAIFTKRGNTTTVFYALGAGFLSVLALQPYVFGLSVGAAWQISIGTLVAFGVMMSGVQKPSEHS